MKQLIYGKILINGTLKKITMKLYTEKQLKEAYNKGRTDWINELEDNNILYTMIPIELPSIDENTSDGYHTFKELYEFRKVYNAALFNEWAKLGNYFVHKSWKHYDGKLCFGGGWFIVVAVLPSGQISNHYEDKDWDLFKIPETPAAMFEFDGHTPQDVLNRLQILNQNK